MNSIEHPFLSTTGIVEDDAANNTAVAVRNVLQEHHHDGTRTLDHKLLLTTSSGPFVVMFGILYIVHELG